MAADGEPQQPFPGAVHRHLFGHDLGPIQAMGAGQRGTQLLGDVRHVIEVGGAAHVDPAPQLAEAHIELLVRYANAGQRRAQALAAEPGKRGFGRNKWLRRTGLENSVHWGSDFSTAPI